MNFSGSLRNSTISANSSFDSSTPATSAKLTCGRSASRVTRARLRPNPNAWSLLPRTERIIRQMSQTMRMVGKMASANCKSTPEVLSCASV